MTDVLVFDNSPLNYFARSGCLGVLEAISVQHARFTTRIVREELRAGLRQHAELQLILDAPWLGVVPEDVRTVSTFARLRRRLGDGEASVIAYSQVHGGTAVIDDQAGFKIAKQEGVAVTRTLNLVADAIHDGRMSDLQADTVLSLIQDAEAYLPAVDGSTLEWLRKERLI